MAESWGSPQWYHVAKDKAQTYSKNSLGLEKRANSHQRFRKVIVNGLLTDQFVVLQLFGVHAVGVPDAAIDFSNSHTLGTITVKVTHGMQTHITKTLHDRIRN